MIASRKARQPKLAEQQPGAPASLGPADTYRLIAFLAGFGITLGFVIQDFGRLALVPAGLALVAVLTKLRFAGPLMVILVLGFLAFSDSQGDDSGFATWLVTLALLVFLITHYRFLAFAIRIFPQTRNRSVLWLRLYFLTPASEEVTKPHRRAPASCAMEEVWNAPIAAIVSLVAAQFLLAIVPEASQRVFDIWPGEWRSIVLIWLAVLMVVVIASLLAWIRWRNLTPREADVYLRSVMWRWAGKEHEALGKYAARRKRWWRA